MQFKLVILDNAIHQLDSMEVKKLLNDLITVKQINFSKTSEHYISMDKHDMCGTHFLIYDVENFLSPNLVLAIRTTYRSRAKQYNLNLPFDIYYEYLDDFAKNEANKFIKQKGDLVDCNAWFVDPKYSKKNSGLDLSEIAYVGVCSYLLRQGYDHFVGCTNEKYKASRWLERVGEFPNNHMFFHPAVDCDHKLILMKSFSLSWLQKSFEKYEEIIEHCLEYRSEAAKVNLHQFLLDMFSNNAKRAA
ncbi:MAG: hypothetical protein MK008_03855 [Bdellovibrionales bacterium]|nr:hypothetical protein [Bdellovibrionales bacterium]